jgi:preprotein translocase subunit YajC
MRLIVGTLTAVGLMFAAPAVAQAQAGIGVGMQITDASGGAVGTVAAVKGDNLLVRTDKHEVLLPKASFTVNNGKLLFGMTQAQLDTEIEKNLAASSAAVVAGATVKGSAGTPVGTIESVADGKATIALQSGKKIAVPEEGLRGNSDGTVTIGYTSEQLEALVAGSTPATDSSASAATTNTSGK